ncbi:hypothetical protein GWK47_005870 [Chionoecetes opilio]|uniref:Uncharacterized protein n=1 Tax=Chionoecetes opilio TaxID=41210 RepID=A0A8J5CJ02_CHIOP|nr:hypothetical protein GWK47_005870 [Chionoecetes opilio]
MRERWISITGTAIPASPWGVTSLPSPRRVDNWPLTDYRRVKAVTFRRLPSTQKDDSSTRALGQPLLNPEVLTRLQEQTDHQVGQNHLQPTTVNTWERGGTRPNTPKKGPKSRHLGTLPTIGRPHGALGMAGYYRRFVPIRGRFGPLTRSLVGL